MARRRIQTVSTLLLKVSGLKAWTHRHTHRQMDTLQHKFLSQQIRLQNCLDRTY